MSGKFDLIKVVLSGPSNSGKTSILEKYITNDFNSNYNYTVGVEFRYKLIKTSNNNIKLHIWDTCGLKHFKDLIKLYYNDANVVIYTFDINNTNSEQECIDCIKSYDMKEDVKLYLLGNKVDLLETNNYKLSDELNFLCKDKNIKFIKCSAKTGENINEVFKEIINNFKFINSINLGNYNYLKSKC